MSPTVAPSVSRLAIQLITCAVLAAPLASSAAECSAVSGAQRVALLELYTSEGCDSCPPADKWVSELPARKYGQDRLVPLAFHVDYWNRLGWTDPFSQPLFSARQLEGSRRRGVSFVVTPQLQLNGLDHRRSNVFADFEHKVKVINETKAQAQIRLKTSRVGDVLLGAVEVSVAADALRKGAEVYLALAENNLTTAVRAGENKGRTLKHDFVVRTLIGPLSVDDNGNLSATHRFELDRRWKSQDISLAAFVQQRSSGDVLQAVAVSCR